MERTISSRSRNLGLGWSNVPVQCWNEARTHSWLGIREPLGPDAEGGLRTVEAELSRAGKLNNGNFWRCALFVGGERVTALWDVYFTGDGDPLEDLSQCREGWVKADRWTGEILARLREGETLRVRMEATNG